MNENASPASEVPATPAPEVVNQTPPEVPSVPAPPPAAELVVHGEVKTERELALERQLTESQQRQRELETTVSEKERDIQELKKIPVVQPAAQPMPKSKRRGMTVIHLDDEAE